MGYRPYGVFFGLIVGPVGLGFIHLRVGAGELRVIADLTLALVLAGEGIAELLAMFTWIAFGAVMMGQFWATMTWDVVIYSLLSLTVIRMLPVLLSLWGSGEIFETKLFLAWFGPRGLASIVFLIIVGASNLPAESVLIHTVVCTVTLCVIAHGLTANFWANRPARVLARKEEAVN